MRSRRSASVLCALLAVLLCSTGCAPSRQERAGRAAGRPLVYVSILPQQDLVQRLCGDRVEVAVLVGPGRSPATYEPTPKQMSELQRADLFLRIGVPFEQPLLAKVTRLMPGLPVIDGRRGIELQPMEPALERPWQQPTGAAPVATGHGEPGAEHGHLHPAGQPDPHFWLDPALTKIHVSTITGALAGCFPGDRSFLAELERRRAALLDELDAVDTRIAKILAPVAGREILVYHPAYGYLTRRYGLRQVAVEVAGKEPSARQLSVLIERARAAGTGAVFVQPQLSDRSARVVAEAIGAEVVPLDPLAPDYLGNLVRMAVKIARACTP